MSNKNVLNEDVCKIFVEKKSPKPLFALHPAIRTMIVKSRAGININFKNAFLTINRKAHNLNDCCRQLVGLRGLDLELQDDELISIGLFGVFGEDLKL